ncbi:unnamed protein product [Closterium sp. NIES-54]
MLAPIAGMHRPVPFLPTRTLVYACACKWPMCPLKAPPLPLSFPPSLLCCERRPHGVCGKEVTAEVTQKGPSELEALSAASSKEVTAESTQRGPSPSSLRPSLPCAERAGPMVYVCAYCAAKLPPACALLPPHPPLPPLFTAPLSPPSWACRAHGVCVCVLCCQVATSMRSPPPSPPSPPSLHCPSLPPELGVQGPWCMCVRTVLPSCHQHALSSPLTPLSPLSSLPLSPPRAGRAGPMVYAVAYCAASTKHRVARMGFAGKCCCCWVLLGAAGCCDHRGVLVGERKAIGERLHTVLRAARSEWRKWALLVSVGGCWCCWVLGVGGFCWVLVGSAGCCGMQVPWCKRVRTAPPAASSEWREWALLVGAGGCCWVLRALGRVALPLHSLPPLFCLPFLPLPCALPPVACLSRLRPSRSCPSLLPPPLPPCLPPSLTPPSVRLQGSDRDPAGAAVPSLWEGCADTAAAAGEHSCPICLSPALFFPSSPPPCPDSKTLTEARREQLFRVMGGPATAAPSGRDNGGSGGDGSSVIVDGGNGNGKGGNGSKAEGVSVAGRDGGEKAEQAGSASAAAGVSVAAAAGGAGEGAGAAEEASVIGWEVDVINAAALSAQMLSRERTSLNAIAFESTAKLIQRVLDQGVNIVEAYVDTLGDPQKHQERLEQRFPLVNFTVAKKADSLFPIVSAASIAAKVTRDHCIQQWAFSEDAPSVRPSQQQSRYSQLGSRILPSQPNEGDLLAAGPNEGDREGCPAGGEEAAGNTEAAAAVGGEVEGEEVEEAGRGEAAAGEAFNLNLGSGYPGDPATKAWLAGSVDPVFGFPSLVRFSWATAKTIMDSSCVPVHWEADEAEEEGQVWAVKQSSPAVSVPGSAPSKRKRKNVRIESVAQKRHSFFRARKLQLVTTSL